NITSERLRFDFSHSEKLTDDELKQVEDMVNEQIESAIPVVKEEMSRVDAEKSGAIGAFGQKYGDSVTIYSIGDFSKEFCGGPHVGNTSEIGRVTITKEESAGAGVRRIYAVAQ
ncbi:MAG: alanine--tRNA ligase, partial [bacterium]|nr:alanine--tRNA ligase [bacterium]